VQITIAAEKFARTAGQVVELAFCRTVRLPESTELRVSPDTWTGLRTQGWFRYATGNVTVNTAPPPGPEAASTLPLCSRRIALQMLRPRPVPRPGRLVV